MDTLPNEILRIILYSAGGCVPKRRVSKLWKTVCDDIIDRAKVTLSATFKKLHKEIVIFNRGPTKPKYLVILYISIFNKKSLSYRGYIPISGALTHYDRFSIHLSNIGQRMTFGYTPCKHELSRRIFISLYGNGDVMSEYSDNKRRILTNYDQYGNYVVIMHGSKFNKWETRIVYSFTHMVKQYNLIDPIGKVIISAKSKWKFADGFRFML